MKLEGMDAATKAVPVPVINQELPPVKSEPVVIKIKQASTGDKSSVAAGTLKKARTASDAQAFDAKYQQQDEVVSEKIVRDAIERANRVLSGSDRKFEISVHEKTREILIKVLDTETNETIREIPPKKIVDLVVRLCEMAGILYDEKG